MSRPLALRHRLATALPFQVLCAPADSAAAGALLKDPRCDWTQWPTSASSLSDDVADRRESSLPRPARGRQPMALSQCGHTSTRSPTRTRPRRARLSGWAIGRRFERAKLMSHVSQWPLARAASSRLTLTGIAGHRTMTTRGYGATRTDLLVGQRDSFAQRGASNVAASGRAAFASHIVGRNETSVQTSAQACSPAASGGRGHGRRRVRR